MVEGAEMKYILGLILIGIGLYLFRCAMRQGGLPDIKDVQDD